MLRIKNITMKNFMSTGAITQSVDLEAFDLTLILGDNIDLGGNGNRNGAGKTVILQAISYALFGIPLTNIKKDNLINKTNKKNMMVCIELEKNGEKYRIERGRKPNHFKYVVNDHVVNEDDTDEAQGDMRESQHDIQKILGFSHTLFKHLIALSTKTTPFLNEKAQVQRDIIEELLGITQLSEKAERLKDDIRATKAAIINETQKISLIRQKNEDIEKTIDGFIAKSKLWEKRKEDDLQNLEQRIIELGQVDDISIELQAFDKIESINLATTALNEANTAVSYEKKEYEAILEKVEKYHLNLEKLQGHKCHTCGQDLHDEAHETLMKEYEEKLETQCKLATEVQKKYEDTLKVVQEAKELIEELGERPKTFYETRDQALVHQHNFESLCERYEARKAEENPHTENIETLKTDNIEIISYDEVNELERLKEHQEFLLKLLTDKNSVVRQKIIEKNLTFLNHRLETYLQKTGLPHQVYFKSDLGVEIMKSGQDFDFDNLSTGESTRLILSLSWAFRDMFEALNCPINLMIIDELIDNGIDASGAENSLAILKQTVRDQNRNIFLISHKDEFASRVDNILLVKKENDFSSYGYEDDYQLNSDLEE